MVDVIRLAFFKKETVEKAILIQDILDAKTNRLGYI